MRYVGGGLGRDVRTQRHQPNQVGNEPQDHSHRENPHRPGFVPGEHRTKSAHVSSRGAYIWQGEHLADRCKTRRTTDRDSQDSGGGEREEVDTPERQ